jgi:hypothetical protein
MRGRMATDRDAVRAARNESLLRAYNEHVEEDRKRRRPSLAQWLCECADENCAAPVTMSIEEYEAVRAYSTRFLVAAGDEHVDPRIEHVVRREDRYWIIEKIGIGAEVSEQLDRRQSNGTSAPGT